MAEVSISVSFAGNAEEAFNQYRKAFKTDFSSPVRRFKDNPQIEGAPKLSAAEANKVTHVALPILGGLQIMGTDLLESYGQKLIEGNNFTIHLGPDTNEEADRLYAILSERGSECIAPHDEFWGYYGTCKTALASAGCSISSNSIDSHNGPYRTIYVFFHQIRIRWSMQSDFA